MQGMKRQEIRQLVKETVTNWKRHDSTTQSGALAFGFLTALTPILDARFETGLASFVGGVDVLVSWVVMTLLLAMIYRVLPDVELFWREPGAERVRRVEIPLGAAS